jgi:hypothetical protein
MARGRSDRRTATGKYVHGLSALSMIINTAPSGVGPTNEKSLPG